MSGVTDPASPYFKDGQWGWDGTVWRKLPLIFGLSEAYRESEVNLNAGAGVNILTASTVPEGEVWVVTHIVAFNTVTNSSVVILQVYDGSTIYYLRRLLTPGVGGEVIHSAPIYLEQDDRVQAEFRGCVAGDDIFMTVYGYKMRIAE